MRLLVGMVLGFAFGYVVRAWLVPTPGTTGWWPR